MDQNTSAIPLRTGVREPIRRSRPKTHKAPVAEYDDLPSSSRNFDSHVSEDQSTVVSSAESLKSDRSFKLERLNLHDIDSTDETQPTRKSKSKCCNHCSLKSKPAPSSQKKTNDEKGVQTSDHGSQSRSSVLSNFVVPQREPIAYDISVENRAKPQEKPKSKTTLQEALKEKRPDFLHDSELRRKALQEISQMRRMGILDSNFTPHLFTYHEVRKRTEELYRQLPEFRERNKGHLNKDTVVSNRIKASVFQKVMYSLEFSLVVFMGFHCFNLFFLPTEAANARVAGPIESTSLNMFVININLLCHCVTLHFFCKLTKPKFRN